MSEGENLDNIQKRKDLGINTMVELLMIDKPNMTEAEAEKKLLKIIEEKEKELLRMQDVMAPQDEDAEGEDEDVELPNGKAKKKEKEKEKIIEQ
jgi:hypothetical protein